MADVAISQLSALGGAPAINDLLVTVDVSDHTQAPTGTTKNLTVTNLFTSPTMSNPTFSGTTSVSILTAALTVITPDVSSPSNGVDLTLHNGGDLVATFSASNARATLPGALRLTGDFTVNTNKFVVTASNGNTAIAGTTASAGKLSVGTTNLATVDNGAAVSVGTGTTTIFSLAGYRGAFAIVRGTNGSATFVDFLQVSQDGVNAGTPINVGGPATRSYSPGANFGLAMSTGTYTVTAALFGAN